jgi:hypothetical protein
MSDHRDSEPKDVLSFGPFSLFVAERLLKKGDEPIPLGGRALDILIALAERPGEIVTRHALISTVWPDVTVEEANLRFKWLPSGRRLVTGETALGTYQIFPVGVIVLLRRSHARAPSNWFRSPGLPPQNELKSFRRDQRGWSAVMTPLERWRSNFRSGASSVS